MQLLHGDCLEVMRQLEANSVDTIITDPPYALTNRVVDGARCLACGWMGTGGERFSTAPCPKCGEELKREREYRGGGFMGKDWDTGLVAFRPDVWLEALRVAKPGAFLLAFGGSRTYHRLTCAIEDAGWEIRDCIMWIYASGFPKSLDIGKAIDAKAGAEREVVGWQKAIGNARGKGAAGHYANGVPSMTGEGYEVVKEGWNITAPATDLARQWDGWGSALKPSFEPVIIAQKGRSLSQEQDIIIANLSQLEARLWSLLPVSTAESPLMLSPQERKEALSIARWSADEATSIRDALLGQMDMSQYATVLTMCLNTVRSWSGILDALLKAGSTSTTATESSTTTDWRTLRFLLSQTTPEDIIRAEMQAPGSASSALPAGRYLTAASVSMNATRELSALESATSRALTVYPEGEGLSPAHEPIVVAMKPLDGTFAANAEKHGVAGLWIDGGRIPTDDKLGGGMENGTSAVSEGWNRPWRSNPDSIEYHKRETASKIAKAESLGRWPANVIFDEESGALLDAQSGESRSSDRIRRNTAEAHNRTNSMGKSTADWATGGYSDTGGASRFFFCAKASRSERNAGLEGMEAREFVQFQTGNGASGKPSSLSAGRDTRHQNHHPTVKPLALMEYLCKLTRTPTGGVVLDPFMGSGSTGVACVMTDRDFIGIEQEAEYLEIARARIEAEQAKPKQLGLAI